MADIGKIKILVVDDEPDLALLMQQQFEKDISSGRIEFVFAQDGVEGLQKIYSNPDIEIVLADINMPMMDGMTLLTNLLQYNPLIRTVMVSAYGDMDNIRRAMNRGAFDFVTKPINFEDLRVTLNRTIESLAALKSSIKEHTSLIDIQKELKFAKKIQDAIIPHNFDLVRKNPQVEIYGKAIPSLIIGGDLFDFFVLSPTKIGLVIADVAGKGVPASLFMAMTRATIRCFASQNLSVNQTIEQTNQFLCSENESDMFVTLFYGVFDSKTGILTYCNAGHNPPIIVSADGTQREIGRYEGVALGVIDNYNFEEGQVELKDQDCLLLYTDGVTEAMDPERQMFSEERLHDYLKQHANDPLVKLITSLVAEIHVFSRNIEQSDDIALLSIRYLKDGQPPK